MAKEEKINGLVLQARMCKGEYCCKRARVNGYCLECEVKYNASQQSADITA